MFLDRCHLLRESLVNPAITTDVIVGFPGETAEEFEQTLETCRRAGFSKIHAFPFSARRGTPAAEMPNQIEKSIKSQRVASLTELETELRKDYFRNLVGSELEMLVESTRQLAPSTTILASSSNHRSQIALEEPTSNDILLRGTSCRYAPVESIIGSTDGTEVAVGDLVRVQINKSDGEKLHGTVISS
jgi:threonylcarbamoyladenosine tRNA methylthiotransferase MtaB